MSLSLHQLVTDGRIHPARIEEVVNKVKKQIEEEIIETGKRTTIDLGIHGDFYSRGCFKCADITAFASDDTAFYFV